MLADRVIDAAKKYHDTPWSSENSAPYREAFARLLQTLSDLRQVADDAARDLCLKEQNQP